jgi:hypothetical protein
MLPFLDLKKNKSDILFFIKLILIIFFTILAVVGATLLLLLAQSALLMLFWNIIADNFGLIKIPSIWVSLSIVAILNFIASVFRTPSNKD